MLKKNLRRSARVFLNLRLHLSVPVERGEEFLGEGKTMDVSQDGASTVVDRDLGVGQTIKIRRVGASKEALARVVGCYQDHRSTGRVFGVALSDKDGTLSSLRPRGSKMPCCAPCCGASLADGSRFPT